MAAAAGPAPGTSQRHSRKRPFSSWVRRLANLKNASSSGNHSSGKKACSPGQEEKHIHPNNPYQQSALPRAGFSSGGKSLASLDPSVATTSASRNNGSFVSYEEQADTVGPSAVYRSNRSTAPTLATNAETIYSDAGISTRGGTSARGPLSSRDGRANSTFSSPQHSQESLTTTLTTIHSTGPDPVPAIGAQQAPTGYPAPPPASAIPGYLIPRTYQAATANGLLSDNASILTLASSTKRRRRSMDTDASVRAIAPTSMYGNSRESLPLSILSANMDPTGAFLPARPAFASAERASVYSSSGAPPLNSERNSYYASKAIDSASVRSGRLGHGRAESISGSVTGVAAGPATLTSPLASPRDAAPRRSSRMSTEIREGSEDADKERDRAETSEDDDLTEPLTPEPVHATHQDSGKKKA